MDDTSFDIAMKFTDESGRTIYAESTLAVHKEDPFMKDFKPITKYDQYSNFFEVESFDFAMNVVPEDTGAGNMSRAAGTSKGQPAPAAAPGRGTPAAGAKGATGGDPFNRWRSATEKDAIAMKFQLNFDSFRFTRVIDGASPLFFRNCSTQIPFKNVALVKRISTGLQGGTERQSLAFMRFDFTEVLLKSLKWSDGELVKESCEFTCQSLIFKYRQQSPDGHLGEPCKEVLWDRKIHSMRKPDGKS